MPQFGEGFREPVDAFLGTEQLSDVVPAVATATPFDVAFVGDTFTGHRNVQMVKVGFNYLFNWGGPVRY